MSTFKRALTRLVVVVLVVGLLGAVGVLLSQLNARTFTVEDHEGQLVVMKGRELPYGSEPFHPADPVLGEAYAPIPLDGLSVDPGLFQQRFTDRDELDRALFEVLQKEAVPRVNADDPQVIDRGFYFVKRAERLSGLTPDQRAGLEKLKADGAYYQGRSKLDLARKSIQEALVQLHLAGDNQNRHTRSANQMLLAVEPAAKALEDALRAAVNQLSAPPAEAPPPAPKKEDLAPPSPAPAPAPAPAPLAGPKAAPKSAEEPVPPPP